MTLARGTRLGGYEIVAPVGAGGMGEVYRARDLRLDRDVAIKVLPPRLTDDPASLARFEREAKAVAALSHPGILSIFDFGSANGLSYAVTELLEGETLRSHVAAGSIPPRKAIEYAVQIADGLAAAHERGIVHRDLKPENLFLTTDGRVKILDFGLARQTGAAADDTSSPTLSHHTDPGTVLGTVGYMSPEQVRGQPAGPASDIFSFGAVFYEMLTGRRAFKGDSAAETMHAILKEEPPDLLETSQSLPPALERIVRHCLEKRPEQRFHSAHDIAFDLRALSEVSGPRPTSAPNAPVKKRPAAGAAALLLLGVAAGVLADRALRRSSTVESPTYRRLTFDRGTMGRARFAPDGHMVVYSAAWRGEPSEVFTTRLDGRESRPFGLAGRLHAVSSTSELAVGLGVGIGPAPAVTLARMPLAGGAPREVLENVTWSDWSPDGAELAVVRVREGIQRVEFPIGRVLYETNDNITNLRVSPRGDWLAFVQNLAGSTFAAGSLVAVDRSGANRVLSRDWTDLWGLAWRPDGRELWFTAGGRGEFKALRAVTLDGKERLVARMLGQIDLEDVSRDGRVLLTHPDFRFEMMALAPGASKERDLTWLGLSALADLSADGSRVLFTEIAQGGGTGGFSYLRKTDGSPPVRLGEGTALGLSPDGRWALCMLTAPSRLVLLPTGVGEARSLTRPGLSYLWWGAWFPDSRRVLFMAQANGGSPHAYVQDIEGGEPRSIGPGGIERAIAAPDGRTVAALAQDGKPVLFSIDDGETRPCPGLGSGDLPIRWSNDGRALFFQRQRGFTAEVHRLEVATGRRKLLSELVVRDLAGASPPGAGPSYGVRLTPDGKSYAYSFARNLSELYLVEGLK